MRGLSELTAVMHGVRLAGFSKPDEFGHKVFLHILDAELQPTSSSPDGLVYVCVRGDGDGPSNNHLLRVDGRYVAAGTNAILGWVKANMPTLLAEGERIVNIRRIRRLEAIYE